MTDPGPLSKAASGTSMLPVAPRGMRIWEGLIEAPPVAVYLCGGRVTFYNRTAMEFSGRKPVLVSDQSGGPPERRSFGARPLQRANALELNGSAAIGFDRAADRGTMDMTLVA